MSKLWMFNIVILVFIIACKSGDQETSKVQAVPVTKVRVKQAKIPTSVFTSGILVSGNEMHLSFKVGGIVRAIKVREGQTVKQGQLLASLDLSEIEAQVSLARSAYDKAMRDLTRIENLYKDSVTTLEQKQNAKTAVGMASANLQIAEFNLEHAVVRAPEDGIVFKKLIESNEMIAPGQPVFFFGSTVNHWRIKVGINERDIVKLNLNDSAYVSFDAYPGKEFPATIAEMAGSSDPYTGTFETDIQILSTKYRLLSGFIGRVRIISSQKEEYYIIPVTALYEADGREGSVFYLTKDDNRVKKQQVELGPLLDGRIAVRSGLAGIDEVISSGSAYLYEGTVVTIVGIDQ